MASSSTLRASSSTSDCDSYEYDVFLSFRGEDTRNNFTDHLYASLVAHGIHTFRDEEKLEAGGHIASNLFRVIEESKIFIIVFSKNYAESKWCLNELVRIMDRMTKKKSTILPVFYHVEPTNVGNQRESYEDAVLYRAGKDVDQKTIETWKNALKTAAKLKGYHLKNNNESEAEFIQKIREKIITTLNRKSLHVGENIVGMNFHLKELKSLIETKSDKVHMVGIYGIGGIGKTTISMAIYNDISSEFYGSSFLKDVGGKGEDDLVGLQKTLLQDILKCKTPEFQSTNQGIVMIQEKLRLKRVLIVVDDVDNYTQLENLAGKNGWYGARSLIIITTRNLHLLNQHEVEKKYEVKILDPEKSTELFCLWAFKQNTPKPNFESLSNSIVKCAGGLPIALRVFGGMLFGNTKEEWQSALDQLKEIPHEDVQRKLKVSYDKLDEMKQKMFLDIACFFRGEDKDFVSRIFGRYAKIGIKVLHDSCLITISKNRIDMHDLLQQMGQEIVRQECVEEPGKRSRLWDPNDVDSVLKRNTGTEAIQGLSVQIFESNSIQFSTDFFTKMNRLRLLKVYSQWWGRNLLVNLPHGIEFPAFNLRYFHFENYPLESLPTNFHAKNLVELNLRNSSIKQLWKENEILNNLKVINLSYSELLEILDFSSVPNLEILILRGCRSLKSLPSSIGHLKALKCLDLKSCAKLVSLPESISNMVNLERLELSFTNIEELPYSIRHLQALKHLDLGYCESLRSLPESIWNLSSVETLIVRGCSNLKGFPEIKEDMENLEWLDLSSTTMEDLPYSTRHLKALKHLNLEYCDSLRSLPESIWNLSSLETLIVKGCLNLKGFPEIKDDMENLEWLDLSSTAIEELPYSIGHLKALKHLNLEYCESLKSLPESICSLSSLETLQVLDCPKLERLEVSLGEFGLMCLILKGGICWSNNRFSSLETLNLQHNKMEGEVLNHHVFPLSSLVELCIRNSRYMQREIHNDSFHLSSLEVLSVGNFNLMELGILDDIFHQSSLETLSLCNCNLMEAGIRSDIWNLSSLVQLSLSNCNLMEGEILNHVCHLSSLQRLSLEGNHFSSIPAGISRLAYLRGLNLSHCNKLQEIPKLPSSLRFLDMHCSEGILSSPSLLSIPSLLNCFNSELIEGIDIDVDNSWFKGKGMSIVMPRSSGIVKGIRNQSIGRDEVEIELPQHWYENNDLFGFALCCVYVQVLDVEVFDDDELRLRGKLAIKEDNPSVCMGEKYDVGFGQRCNEHNDDSVSDQVWVIYYPKDAIVEEYEFNQWTRITASFDGLKSFRVKECGIHPIYGCFKCQQNEGYQQNLCLKGEAINELPFIEPPFELGSLCLRECKNLKSLLPSTICKLKSLTTLSCCSELKIFPEIPETTLENLRELHLDGTAIEELPSSIQHLRGLQCLNLAYCNNLVSLPRTICHLKSLVFLSCSCCSQLKIFPEIPETTLENLRELHLDGTVIEEIPSSIQHLTGLQCLNLAYCNNLVSLPRTICHLKSLVFLSCSCCSQLKIFPEIPETTLENLRELHLDGTAIEELSSSIQHLRGLQCLNMAYCNNLVSLPRTICHLKSLVFLSCSCCSQLKIFPEIPETTLENLRELHLDGTAIEELPSSIQHLRGLHCLNMAYCTNLVNLPKSICNLKFLKILNVNFCSKLEKFPEILVSLQCLERLGVAGFYSNMSSWEALSISIVQLSKLRVLDLSHCQKLLQMPQLPQSLRFLDAHGCPYLETLSSPSSLLGFSMFKSFKSAIEEFECGSYWRKEITIFIPGNSGIPDWISHQKKRFEITIELPMGWWQDNNFLGFALCSVFVPLHIESKEDPCSLKCELNFRVHEFESPNALPSKIWSVDELSFRSRYQCCRNGGESNRVWVAYYPKVAIENKYWSNLWRYLKASFRGKGVKVEKCGFHLIYEPNNLNRDSNGTNHWPRLLRENTDFNVKRSLDDAEDHPKQDPHQEKSRHF